MLGLCFEVARQRFAVDCRGVEEVLPMLELRPLLPDVRGVRGLASVRGAPLPVLDLGVLLAGEPCDDRLSTRVIVTIIRGVKVGLVAERVTDVMPLDPAAMRAPGLRVPDAPFLGEVIPGEAPIQILTLSELLPPRVLALLGAV
jgi:chemotaxis-related protein WspB